MALDRFRPTDLRSRGQEYRSSGRTRFDPSHAPALRDPGRGLNRKAEGPVQPSRAGHFLFVISN